MSYRAFKRLLGDGSQWGLEFCYAEQPRPEGLAQAFLIGAPFVGTDNSCLILGDNIFYGHDLVASLRAADQRAAGATVFAYHVQDARSLIASGKGVGRKLDFLAQEFNREANTLCSKSTDIALTRTGLALKAVIDQLREQAQNVE